MFATMRPDVVIDAAHEMSTRKHRLFACACCRRFWDEIRDPRSQEAVRVAEQYADGQTTRTVLSHAYREADIATLEWTGRLCGPHGPDFGPDEPVITEPQLIFRKQQSWWLPLHTAKHASAWAIRGRATHEVSWCTAWIFVPDAMGWDYVKPEAGEETRMALVSEVKTQIALLRDVFQSHPPVDLRWLTSAVIDLANAIYQERAFERMPILADALMDAGCDSEEIINHCRGNGPHVRGCWVVDLLLAKQ